MNPILDTEGMDRLLTELVECNVNLKPDEKEKLGTFEQVPREIIKVIFLHLASVTASKKEVFKSLCQLRVSNKTCKKIVDAIFDKIFENAVSEEKCYPESQNMAIAAYANGFERNEINEVKTFEWLKKFAERGHSEAQYEVGRRYCAGLDVTRDCKVDDLLGVIRDYTAGLAWYEKAVAGGYNTTDAKAQYQLGESYMVVGGDDDLKNRATRARVRAFELFEKSANQGHPEAQYELAFFYAFGLGGVQENMDKALELFKKAAQQGHRRATYKVGMCYVKGGGIQNRDKALEWFKKVSERGDKFASLLCNPEYDVNHHIYAGYNPDYKPIHEFLWKQSTTANAFGTLDFIKYILNQRYA